MIAAHKRHEFCHQVCMQVPVDRSCPDPGVSMFFLCYDLLYYVTLSLSTSLLLIDSQAITVSKERRS